MDEKLEELRRLIGGLESVAVAFSGGCDSTLLLKVCVDVLGDRAVAVTGISPSLAPSELEHVRRTARDFGVHLVEVGTHEQEDPRYIENTPERCYFCKSELFERIAEALPGLHVRWIVEGTNLSDIGEHRPGHRAAGEQNVRSPLLEVGLRKEDVRRYAQALGLPTWDKPASPCLASRVPYGTPVTPEILARVGRAEAALRALGFRELRVRHHGRVARLELAPDELPRAFAERATLVREVRAAGYFHVTLDLDGYRRGGLIAAFEAEKACTTP